MTTREEIDEIRAWLGGVRNWDFQTALKYVAVLLDALDEANERIDYLEEASEVLDALDEGERSPVADNYSLESMLAKVEIKVP